MEAAARGARIFAMTGTLVRAAKASDAEVGEIDAVVPASGEETGVEQVGIAQVIESFGHAHVQPDA